MGYYKGDYYRGDPGFFSFLGRLGKGIISSVTGVNIGGGKVPSPSAPAALPMGSLGAGTMGRVGTTALAMAKRHPVMAAAGGAALGALGLGGVATMRRLGKPAAIAMAGTGEVPKGYHISHRTGAVVRNRHMHMTNPRALRRALRRAHGFAALAMKTIHLVHPKKKGRFGGFKKRRKTK
jgi:hypothetical protein